MKDQKKHKSKKYPVKTFGKVQKFEKVTAQKTLVRLNRFLANAGVCSRREADELIQKGLVKVNGKKVTVLGTKVSYADKISYKGELLSIEKKVYLVLNKPKDFICTSDPHVSNNVMQLVKNACKERIYPVGRLDKNTTGVLLFTNDGNLTKKLTHPKYNKKKIYHVFIDRKLIKNDFEKIAAGFELDDGFIQPDAICYVGNDKMEIGMELHSGRNRIVRRIFEYLGYKVKKLDRVFFAGITKKNISRSQWRFLTDKEVRFLKNS